MTTRTPTPWAVICPHHGQQFLTGEEYDSQIMAADYFWFCPVCGEHSEWDDDNYETHYYNNGDEQ